MSVCAYQPLINECYAGLESAELDWIIAQLLCNLKGNIVSGTPVICDVQSLLDDAKCFAALPPQIVKVISAQLLCDISVAIAAGGGGGGYLPKSGHGDPNGVVVGVIEGDIYTDLDTGTFWKFLGTAGTDTGWV